MRFPRLSALAFGTLLFGCSARSSPSPRPGAGVAQLLEVGGGPLVAGRWLHLADGDEDAPVGVDPHGSGAVSTQHIGQQPQRIARFGDRLYVSLRGERALVVLEETPDGNAREIGRIATGHEPYGVAANADRIYVAESLSGTVAEFDAHSFQRLRSFAAPPTRTTRSTRCRASRRSRPGR